MCCSPCSCCVNSGLQVLLDIYGKYLQGSGLKGTYHGLLAELHSLVVDQDKTDASAEALVSQLVQENVLRLTTPGVPRNGTNHIHIRQQDAQYVLWLMLDRLAREVGLGCMLLLSKSCDSPLDGLPGRPQQQGLASGIAC